MRRCHTTSDDDCREPIFMKNSCLSKEKWHRVDAWRARECYSYIARKILNRPNLQRWNDFHWDDYLERVRFKTTFDRRHLQILNGTETVTQSELKDPASWSHVESSSTTPKTRSTRSEHTTVVAPAPDEVAEKVWDFKLQMWVDNTMGSEAPAALEPPMSEEPKKKSKKKVKKRKSTRGAVRSQPKRKQSRRE